MKILLDTHCFLWAMGEPERLEARERQVLADPSNEIYLSAATTLELSIKVALGKIKLPEKVGSFVSRHIADQGYIALPIQHAHAAQVEQLPPIHRDPFDRILIAQTQIEALLIMTHDPEIRKYNVQIF